MSDGDDAEEQHAEKTLAEATRDKRGIATATQALNDEVEKLEASIAKTNQTLKDLRHRQLREARFGWADRLDKAAQHFAAIAAHLNATAKAMGRSSILTDLHVPLHVSFGSRSINADTVNAKADAISIEQLIAGWLPASHQSVATLLPLNRNITRGTPNMFRAIGLPVYSIWCPNSESLYLPGV